MELVIASQNTHKVLELREILKSISPELHVRSLFDFPSFQPDTKTGISFQENAKEKAKKAAQELKTPCLAEDSGLVIPVLGGIDYTLKIRSESQSHTSIQKTKALLKELSRYSEIERYAYLECSIAIATPDGKVQEATARCEGILSDEERGKGSFDFDTIFIKHDYSKTLAELPASVRSRISFRRKACEKLIPIIERLKI